MTISDTLKSLYKFRAIKDIKLLEKLLESHIIVVDVGSTGGIDKRFKELEKLLHVITFDPDPRAITPITKGKFKPVPQPSSMTQSLR